MAPDSKTLCRNVVADTENLVLSKIPKTLEFCSRSLKLSSVTVPYNFAPSKILKTKLCSVTRESKKL